MTTGKKNITDKKNCGCGCWLSTKAKRKGRSKGKEVPKRSKAVKTGR